MVAQLGGMLSLQLAESITGTFKVIADEKCKANFRFKKELHVCERKRERKRKR